MSRTQESRQETPSAVTGAVPSGVYGDELDENGRVMDTTSDNVQANDEPADCFTEAFYVRCPSCRGNPNSPFWQGWATLRLKTYRLIENKYFETAVITMILLSSGALVSDARDRRSQGRRWSGKAGSRACFLLSKSLSSFELNQTIIDCKDDALNSFDNLVWLTAITIIC